MAKKSSSTAKPSIIRLPVAPESSVESLESNSIRTVKVAQAPKLSLRAHGVLTYALGIDDASGERFIQIQHNDSGGYFSREWVALNNIQACLAQVTTANTLFAASLFKSAFISPSQNNAGFLAAILKAEGILSSAAEKINGLHYHPERWSTWLAQWGAEQNDHPLSDDDDTLNQCMQLN